MGHKVYISFKTEDAVYKSAIQEMAHLDYVDKSLNEPINSTDPDYILQRIRSGYLYDSTVTIFLIGAYGAENRGSVEQRDPRNRSPQRGDNGVRRNLRVPHLRRHPQPGERERQHGRARVQLQLLHPEQ